MGFLNGGRICLLRSTCDGGLRHRMVRASVDKRQLCLVFCLELSVRGGRNVVKLWRVVATTWGGRCRITGLVLRIGEVTERRGRGGVV
jgi:hypothetical protein